MTQEQATPAQTPQEIVQEFLDKMRSQDNRGTAPIMYLVIRDEKWVASYHQDEGDRYCFVPKSDPECAEYHTSKEDFYEAYAKEHKLPYAKNDYLTIYDIEKRIEKEYDVYAEKRDWKNKGMFLTETDAVNHLKSNKHHYSPNAHVYGEHAWRAPELLKFFEALYKLYPHQTTLKLVDIPK